MSPRSVSHGPARSGIAPPYCLKVINVAPAGHEPKTYLAASIEVHFKLHQVPQVPNISDAPEPTYTANHTWPPRMGWAAMQCS